LFGYPETLASYWTGEDDLIVIEGDKEINADVIPSFNDCDEPWCTFKYKNLPPPYRKTVTIGLGCAKFSAETQKIVPVSEFVCADVPWQPCRLCKNAGCWQQLDARLAMALEKHGIDFPHLHGNIKHHHTYDDAWWNEHYKDVDYLMDTEARMKDIDAYNLLLREQASPASS
jgi:hypothetical protein